MNKINPIISNATPENALIVQVKVKRGNGQIIAEGNKLTVYTNEPRESPTLMHSG